jgi:carboxymethylenebutenolidase
MGGALALLVAADRPDAVQAVAPFYGVLVWPAVQPDYKNMAAAVQGHYAENDDFANAEAVGLLEQELRDLGKDVEIFTYPGTEHAFFNDTRPEVHNAAASQTAWSRVIDFFRSKLS